MRSTILIINYVPSAEQKSASFDEWREIAQHISTLSGLRWKYWIRATEDGTYGGVYLFDTLDQAKVGGSQLESSLAGAGARDITSRFFDVDADLSAVTRGSLPRID